MESTIAHPFFTNAIGSSSIPSHFILFSFFPSYLRGNSTVFDKYVMQRFIYGFSSHPLMKNAA
jgi:hypothetical protein